MEKLIDFSKKFIKNEQLKKITGGSNGQDATRGKALRSLTLEPKVYDTGAFIDDNYTPEDYWTDNDGDGDLSPGDTMCFN
jgi:hypothetical protein